MHTPFDVFIHDFTLNTAGACLVVGWMFLLGSVFGSFFNVVAYRLPLGMSLSHPGSQCPVCRRPIRWYDNVPIFGWLMLRGRCRNCGARISFRYPLVELIVAIASALVAWAAISPAQDADPEQPFAIQPLVLVFYLLLVDTLICSALLEFDRHRLPLRTFLVVLSIGIATVILWPEVRPLSLEPTTSWPGLLDNGLALAAALLLGLLAWPMLVDASLATVHGGVTRVVALATVAVFLGVAGVAVAAALAAVLLVVSQIAARFYWPAARFGWLASLTTGTLVWIVGSSKLVGGWVGADLAPLPTLAVAGALVALASLVVRAVQVCATLPAKG